AGTQQTQVPPFPDNGTLIHAGITSPNHQHFFNFRLDLDIDGQKNSIYESNIVATPPGKDNPCSLLWDEQLKLLKTEKKAIRNINPLTARHWVFANDNSKNSLGYSRSYALEPAATPVTFQGHCARPWKKTYFTHNSLFVTKFHDEELYAEGKYPVEKPKDEGSRVYIKDNESIVNEDIVAWYTLSFAHDPEVEDYPVLNSHVVSFKLTPSAFFDLNPAVDVNPNNALVCCGGDSDTCHVDPQ